MAEKRLAVVVLAAGAGTRMRSAKPKVMHDLAGMPMLGHVLTTAHALGGEHVIAVLRHQRDEIASWISDFSPTTKLADQDDLPGTGRAVECALEALPADFDGAVVVVSADVPLLDTQTLDAMLVGHLETGAAVTLLSTWVRNPAGYGRIVRSEDGEFASIVEHKDASEEQLEINEINAGVYVFDAAKLRAALAKVGTANAQGEKYLTDVATILKGEAEKVELLSVADNWLVAGVNDRYQLGEVAAELNRRICFGWQMAGVTILDPTNTWIDIRASIGEDAVILPGTHIQGVCTIGRGAKIGPEVVLVDSEVGDFASVVKSHITGSIIGEGATVGPFSYLRPGTELGADGKIGTFVETKNAKIGAGSKVPHLSYVGDAVIGVESNIGAGTIFANYDGVEKHSSVIGSHVRTGSHNVFVAPISIGDGAYTAAGTVVRRSVEPGDLAMNVAPQRNIADWVLSRREGSKAAKAAAEAKAAKTSSED